MKGLKRIWSESQFIRLYIVKYKKQVFLGLMALILVDALEAFLPYLLKKVIDALEAGVGSKELLQMAILYFVVHLFQAVGRYGWRMYLSKTSMFAGLDLRENYTKHLFSLSQNFYDRKKVGDLMSLATNDTEAVRRALGPGLLVFADAVFYLMTIPLAMMLLSFKLTLVALIPLLFVPLIVLRNEKIIHFRFTKAQEAFSYLSVLAQENLMGIRVIKAFAKEVLQIHKFNEAGLKYFKINMGLARIQSSFGPSLDFILSLSMVCVLYFGGQFVISDALTLGTFVAFQRYIQKMIWPMEALGFAVVFYQRAVASSKRLDQIFIEAPLVQDKKSSHFDPFDHHSIRIEIRNLSFNYPTTQKKVLKNIHLTIESGEKVAFVGSIGCGKSTLLCLFPRIYPVENGKIFLNGIDINEWPLEFLRQSIGYVPQDHFLFSESVFQNILFGVNQELKNNSELLWTEVQKLSEICAVKKDIEQLPEKFKTKLGERGVNLSGGQKQRISIARALFKKPQLLILDDSLSAVDTETENLLLNSIVNENQKRTQLISAHRISTVQRADRIVVLEEGEIVDQGSHSKLIQNKSGLYYKFYEQQRLKDEILLWGQKEGSLL